MGAIESKVVELFGLISEDLAILATWLNSERNFTNSCPHYVKTITVTIPEGLDQRAATEARRRGISKSQLVRQGLTILLTPEPDDPEEDLWRSLAGFGSPKLSTEEGEIDDVVYER